MVNRALVNRRFPRCCVSRSPWRTPLYTNTSQFDAHQNRDDQRFSGTRIYRGKILEKKPSTTEVCQVSARLNMTWPLYTFETASNRGNNYRVFIKTRLLAFQRRYDNRWKSRFSCGDTFLCFSAVSSVAICSISMIHRGMFSVGSSSYCSSVFFCAHEETRRGLRWTFHDFSRVPSTNRR
jgi:hypothetical protein